jgi:methionine synthase II (cobalamin-independent)
VPADGLLDVPRGRAVDVVQTRMMRVLDVVPRDRLPVPPDCGPRHLPAAAARAKLHTMTNAAALVRDRLEKETRP